MPFEGFAILLFVLCLLRCEVLGHSLPTLHLLVEHCLLVGDPLAQQLFKQLAFPQVLLLYFVVHVLTLAQQHVFERGLLFPGFDALHLFGLDGIVMCLPDVGKAFCHSIISLFQLLPKLFAMCLQLPVGTVPSLLGLFPSLLRLLLHCSELIIPLLLQLFHALHIFLLLLFPLFELQSTLELLYDGLLNVFLRHSCHDLHALFLLAQDFLQKRSVQITCRPSKFVAVATLWSSCRQHRHMPDQCAPLLLKQQVFVLVAVIIYLLLLV
mmetsp:Transcript_135770/g.321748  ORF Transcript_135770/g.321748 Transcript_135770/m.321748 type:complete len:267 (+) Transcript_135770:666-1466(+)